MRSAKRDRCMSKDGLQCLFDALVRMESNCGIVHVGNGHQRSKRLLVTLCGGEQESCNAPLNHARPYLLVRPSKERCPAARPNAPPLRPSTQECRPEYAGASADAADAPFPAFDLQPPA